MNALRTIAANQTAGQKWRDGAAMRNGIDAQGNTKLQGSGDGWNG